MHVQLKFRLMSNTMETVYLSFLSLVGSDRDFGSGDCSNVESTNLQMRLSVAFIYSAQVDCV